LLIYSLTLDRKDNCSLTQVLVTAGSVFNTYSDVVSFF